MLGVAVGWQFYALTGSALDLASIVGAGLWMRFVPELRRLGGFEE